MGHGVYTCSGSTVMIMTTGAQESGKDDAVWAMLQEATNPDYIKMVVDVNGAVPARSSVMDAIPDYCEGGTLYLYRQQLESGISFLRPYTPAHMTIYDAMASVIGNIYAGEILQQSCTMPLRILMKLLQRTDGTFNNLK